MVVRVTTGRALLAATLGPGLATGVQTADSSDIGPLPQLEIDKVKAELGKRLFFDKRLSGDAAISCADCHVPAKGYASEKALSPGYPGNGEDDIMEARMAVIPEYRQRFKDVFGTEWPLIDDVWLAISAFERTMNTTGEYEVPLDKYLKGDKSALDEQQVRGMALFNGKAGCINCHNGSLATDLDYHNIGIPPNKRWEEDGLAQVTFRFEQYAKGQTEEGYRAAKSDWGFYYRSKNKWDRGKFRTAPLRYIEYTAPYMHNGVFYTLEEVVDFYNAGGVDEEGRTTLFPENKSKLIKPLGLSDEEKEDLVAFLGAFSGPEITMEKPKQPPYAHLFTKAELEAAQEAK